MIKTYLEAGKIINKRGLAGELKIESYCDTPEAFCSFKHVYLAPDGTDVRKVLSAKLYNGYAYIRLEGVTTAEQADKLRGKSVYIHRNDLELDKDSVFIDDILELPVTDADSGVTYGVLKEVFNRGASDIYRVAGQNGKEYLIPAVKEIIVRIEPQSGIYIRPIPGLIDDAEEIR